MNGLPMVPRSVCEAVVWPAFTDDASAQLLALQYQLEQSQWWPAERIAAMQLAQFQLVYDHARSTVPFWRERYAQGPARIATMDDLRRLPVTTRREIQQAGEAMYSTAPLQAHGPVVSTRSSGSTGEPLQTLGTAWTQLLWQALLLRDHLWHGRDLGSKLAAIRNRGEAAHLPDWGPATSPFITGPSAVRAVSGDLDEQLDWLVAENPDYLLSLATNVHALAARSLERGIRLPRLKQVRTFAEMLLPDVRDLVREAWGVDLVDSYSSEELGNIALQCPQHEHYHLQSESLLVEVLDDDGHPCAPGQTGQLVVSTLHNFAMPLLRYASGDYAEAGPPCACGRGLPVLKRIVGRQRNMLWRPDGGGRYWPSFATTVWEHLAPIERFQVVQTALDRLELRVVCARELTAAEHDALALALQDSLGFRYAVTVTRLATIERSRGGKYEDFICALD
ncbi:MAG: phenylacetate--CoA ligase family protein [Betaproteobacteria bacterium]